MEQMRCEKVFSADVQVWHPSWLYPASRAEAIQAQWQTRLSPFYDYACI